MVALQQSVEHLKLTQNQLVQSEKLAGLGSVVAAVSHELNTPIGNCLTVSSALSDQSHAFLRVLEGGKLHRSELQSYVENVASGMELLERGLERTAGLIGRFKQVAVDQTGGMRRTFALREVCEDVWALQKPALRSKGYRLEIDVDKSLRLDSYPGLLEQLLSNLINNAVLHAFEGREQGLMRVHAQVEEGHLHMTFSDDGCGMTDEVKHQIFNPFFTTRLGTGGSGLGMNIVYTMVTGPLGGDIRVDSAPGQGATFTLRIPLVAPVTSVKVA